MTSEKQIGDLVESAQELPKKQEMIGHFTWRFLKDLDKKYIEELKGRLTSEYEDEPYARRHAIMNLLGFVHCCLHEMKTGIELFQLILKEDETNLNAVCNLVHALDGISRQKEKRKYEEQYTNIMAQPDTSIFRARALIEAGRAACFTDQHHKHADVEFAKKLFDAGLELGKENPNKVELMDWKFGLAYHLLRLDKKCRNDNIPEYEYLKKSIEEFYQIALFPDEARSVNEGDIPSLQCQPTMQLMKVDFTETGDERSPVQNVIYMKQRINDMRGKAWAFIGVLMNWHKEFANLNSVLVECKREHRHFEGYQCLANATEIAPKCGVVLRRVAQEFYEKKKFDQALDYGQKAIQVQPIGFAFYPVGQVYLSMYQDEIDPDNKDKTLLDLAIQYFQDAIDRHFKPSYAIRDLAIAYLLRGDATTALEKFKMAAEATGGQRDHRLFLRWAQCLDELDENEAANEKRNFARKIKTRTIASKYDFIAVCCLNDTELVSDIVESVEKRLRLTGYMFERNCLPGTNVSDEMENLIKTCSVFLIFVSKNSVSSANSDQSSDSFKDDVNFVTKQRQDSTLKIIPIYLDIGMDENLPYALNILSGIRGIKYDSDSRDYWRKVEKVFNSGV